jgi:hypothetical protein
LLETEDFTRRRHALEPDAPQHVLNVLLHELQRAENEPARAVRNLRSLLRQTNWYTTSPAVPMSYWLGRLENERLRQRLVAGRGWSLQKFNDWLLSFGNLPQAWIEKYGLD